MPSVAEKDFQVKCTKHFLETLDPRTKIISIFFIVSCMALTPMSRIKDFGAYFLLILAIFLFSDISPARLLRKFRFALFPITVLPFLLLVILFLRRAFICYFIKGDCSVVSIVKEEIWTFLCFIIKLDLSIVFIVVVSVTMSYTDFLRGVEKLYIPQARVSRMVSALYHILQLINSSKRLLLFEMYRFIGFKHRKKLRKYIHSPFTLFDKRPDSPGKDHRVLCICADGEIYNTAPLRFSYRDFLFMIGVIVMLVCIISGLIYKIGNIKISHSHLWQNLQM